MKMADLGKQGLLLHELDFCRLRHIWPSSCEKGPLDMCNKCRPRPAAASLTQRLIRVCTF